MQTESTARLAAEPSSSRISCPECGSFLDKPRLEPLSGEPARKCLACLDWYPLFGRAWEGSD